MNQTIGRTLAQAFSLLSLTVIAAGCAANTGPQRQSVQGAVQLDGRPLPAGVIRFIPDAGTKGPAATATIVDGFYEVPRHLGPVTGRQRVEIEGLVEIPFEIDDEAAYAATFTQTKGKPLPPQPIPPEYNRMSTLAVEVSGNPEQNKFDFDLRRNLATSTATASK